MKRIVYSFSAICLILLSSCSEEFGTTTVTYTKATGIYADLDEVRQTPLKGEVSDIVNPGKIFVSGNRLLIGEENEGIHVIDNSNPENPINIAFINIPGNREFYVENNMLYAESYYDMLKIDISNVNQPTLVSRVENAFITENIDDQGRALIGFTFEEAKLELNGDEGYYSQIQANNVNYFDYRDRLIPPSNVPASFAGNSQQGIGTINRIAYNNNHVYVIGNEYLTTFSDHGHLERISSNVEGWSMETIFPYNDMLFIGTQNSMEVFDVSQPDVPTQMITFTHANSCDPVFPIDNTAYITLRSVGTNCPGDDDVLIVLDISDVFNPIQMDEIRMASPFGMTMIGDKLYVGEGENGLKIFDASDKLNLRLEAWDRNIQAYDVLEHPERSDILLIAGPGGLNQYTIEVDERVLLSSLSF